MITSHDQMKFVGGVVVSDELWLFVVRRFLMHCVILQVYVKRGNKGWCNK